ncbi:hypothetical protein FACS1894170_08850 [Planctomycetales bacterium]|nr:hypothetical protein FACS1894170_08850 [Planctomycetales bacterium]
MNTRLISKFLLGTVCTFVLATALQAATTATTPVSKENEKWWQDRHTANVAAFEKGDIELLLIGDSITHGWDSNPDIYQKYFGPYKPVNLGFGGDQTQHVLWRLEHLPLDKIQPKVAQIMIGTNNVHSCPPKDIAEGILEIVKKLQKQYPKLQIIVLKIFPRDEKPDGDLRKKVDAVNAELPTVLKGLKNVEIVDINAGFLDKDGTLPKSIMPDFLHPNKDGEDYWGKAVEPIIKAKFAKYDGGTKKRQRGDRPRRLFR